MDYLYPRVLVPVAALLGVSACFSPSSSSDSETDSTGSTSADATTATTATTVTSVDPATTVSATAGPTTSGATATEGTTTTPTGSESSTTDSTTDPTTTGPDTGSESTAAEPVCPNGIVEGDEECDDANAENTDACLATCVDASCGDGFVQEGVEECDDMNKTANDGCENNCDLSTGVAQLSTLWYNTCARFFSGAVRCWGFGHAGQLGNLSTENIGDDEPASSFGDIDVGAPLVVVEAGANFACGLTEDGLARCWGDNYAAQLGLGNLNNLGDDEAPSTAPTVNAGGLIIDISAGRNHVCVVLLGGSVRCWGSAVAGFGYANTATIGDDEDPAAAGDIALGGVAVQVASGMDHICALLDDGAVRCWGNGASGRLGYGNTTAIGDNETPDTAGDVNIGGTAVQISAGAAHTCVLLDTGNVRCWGLASSGQLGYGNTASIGDDETPASAGNVSVGGTVVQIAAGQNHTCALLATGYVRCWGLGSSGQLGYANVNSIGDDELPSAAGDVAVGTGVLSVSAGDQHTCVRTTANAVRCWGNSQYGQLGYGNMTSIGDNETPGSAGNVPLF